jgi:hypothetical protein
MYPNQPNPNQIPPQGGFPPPTPQPQGYNPQPVQPQNFPPQQPPTGPNGQPNWYVPPPTKAPERPASAADYVNRAQQQTNPQPQNPTGSMQPGNPNSQYPIDYLNQLAGANSSTTQFNPKIVIGGIVGFLITALAVLFLVFNNGGGPVGPKPEETLYKTIVDTAQITNDSKRKISSNKLVSINSSLNIVLLNSITGMTDPLQKSGLEAKKLESAAKKEKAFEKPMAKLEDARLNAIYDRAYVREIDFKIQSMLLLIEKINKMSTNKSLKDYLGKTKPDIEKVKDELDDFKKSDSTTL